MYFLKMNFISLVFNLLLLHSSSSHDQEDKLPLQNEEFLKVLQREKIYYLETFNNKVGFTSSWIPSQALKATEDGGTLKYDGDWTLEQPLKDALPSDFGLTFKEKARHRAISSKLIKDFKFYDKPLILQYEVLHQDGQECGGAYLKLLSKQRPVKTLHDFNDKTPYTIMFGPDKCGARNQLHFIFRYKNPTNGSFEEKHCKPPKTKIDEVFTDTKPHLFKLVMYPDNTFVLFVDNKVVNDGSLLDDFNPPVNPPAEIDDPSDNKPSDWDDREKIYDPSAKKPVDWDETEPYQIPDPNAIKPEDWLDEEPINIRDPSAEKPDDWDNEMDGEWEAPLVPNPACEEVSGCGLWSPPLINNPKYKGKWTPPLIDNPDYKGVWTPRKIPNPNFYEDEHPFRMSTVDAIGFEIWSMSAKIMFDNIIITDDESVSKQFESLTYDRKIINIEKSAETLWTKIMVSLNYKPGWWSLYFIYCFIPIAVYVWYLWRRVKEDTILNQFIAFTNRHPWLWAFYVVVLLVPVTLIVVCCFWTTKDSESKLKKEDDSPMEIQEESNSISAPDVVEEDTKLIEEINEKEEDSAVNKEEEIPRTKREGSQESEFSLSLSFSLTDEEEENETGDKTEGVNQESEKDQESEKEPESVLRKRKEHSSDEH